MSPAVADRRPFQGFGYYTNTGVGTESEKLANFFARQFIEAASRPILLRPKIETLETLKTVFTECNKENWDGEGAVAISPEAYLEAYKLISLLPSLRQMPEIIPSPNGQIGFEWYVEKNHLLVLATA